MLCVRSCFEFIERLFYGAVWADLSPFLFRVYRGLFLPFCFIINPHIACYARLMMKQKGRNILPIASEINSKQLPRIKHEALPAA